MARDTSMFGVDRRNLMKGLSALGITAAVGTSSSTAETEESTPDRRGPLRNNRFLVEIDGIEISGFSRVELPDATNTDVGYREGNDAQASARRLKAGNEFDSLILERGAEPDQLALYEWYKRAEQGKVDEARRSIAVVVLDTENNPAARWEFREAWPARYDAPDLDATAKGVALETVEVLHEGMERKM